MSARKPVPGWARIGVSLTVGMAIADFWAAEIKETLALTPSVAGGAFILFALVAAPLGVLGCIRYLMNQSEGGE